MIVSYQKVEGFVTVSAVQASAAAASTWEECLVTGSQGVIEVLGERMGIPLDAHQSHNFP